MTEFLLTREEIASFMPSPRAVRRFEELQRQVLDTTETVTAGVTTTDAIRDGTFVTLSANTELTNERVLALGAGLAFSLPAGQVVIVLTNAVPRSTGGFSVQFSPVGDCILSLPASGFLATRENAETLKNKVLDAPMFSGLGDYANDAAAAAGGVLVNGAYRNGSVLMVRVV